MNRRLFISLSSTFMVLPLAEAAEDRVCETKLNGLEGIDFESGWAEGFLHYHQLIIPTVYLISPPQEINRLMTCRMDLGSFDQAGFEKYAIVNNIGLEALRKHDHDVYVTREELLRIASGEENVELKAFKRDAPKIHVHSFFVTAPPSALAAVKQAAGTRVGVCTGRPK